MNVPILWYLIGHEFINLSFFHAWRCLSTMWSPNDRHLILNEVCLRFGICHSGLLKVRLRLSVESTDPCSRCVWGQRVRTTSERGDYVQERAQGLWSQTRHESAHEICECRRDMRARMMHENAKRVYQCRRDMSARMMHESVSKICSRWRDLKAWMRDESAVKLWKCGSNLWFPNLITSSDVSSLTSTDLCICLWFSAKRKRIGDAPNDDQAIWSIVKERCLKKFGESVRLEKRFLWIIFTALHCN